MKYDKLTRYLTVIWLILIVAAIGAVFLTSSGTYFPAWLTTLGLSIALLGTLSIPKYAIISPQSVEIHCMLELTRVEFTDIERVKILQNRDMKWCIPFFGIFGIFGYYGYYIDLKRFRTFKLYARRWSNFIMIEDVYDNKLIFSVEDPQLFISKLEKYL